MKFGSSGTKKGLWALLPLLLLGAHCVPPSWSRGSRPRMAPVPASSWKTETLPPGEAPALLEEWVRTSFGLLLLPEQVFWDKTGAFDLVFHFHGGPPAEQEWAATHLPAVIASANFGVGSTVYSDALASPDRFGAMLDEAQRLVRERTGQNRLRLRRVALAGWSAGYGAIRQILSQGRYDALLDAVLLIDGLHTSYVRRDNASPMATPSPSSGRFLDEKGLEAFEQFARLAAQQKRLMVVTHSSILPPDYGSTTETASFLIDRVGGHREYMEIPDERGLMLYVKSDIGFFYVLGYRGDGPRDHVLQVKLITDVARDYLGPRWAENRPLR